MAGSVGLAAALSAYLAGAGVGWPASLTATEAVKTFPAPPGGPVKIRPGTFEALLTIGALRAYTANTQEALTDVISGPGVGEILKIHAVYNQARAIEADTMTASAGLLNFNYPAVNALDVQSIVVRGVNYTKSVTSSGKWVGVPVTAPKVPAQEAGAQLVAMLGSAPITASARDKAGDIVYTTSFTTNGLEMVESVGGSALETAKSLNSTQIALLEGMTFSVPKMEVAVDALGRVVEIQALALMTETAADAAARGMKDPQVGSAGTMALTVLYNYGGTLAITAPPASQVNMIGPAK